MKKLLFVLLAIAMTVPAFAQTKLSLGVEAGINIANTTETPTSTLGTRTGLLFGGMLDIDISKNITITPEVRFVMAGNSGAVTGGVITNKASIIEINALLKTKFPTSEIKPYLFAGPSLGLILSVSQDQTPTGGQTQNFDISSNFETINFGILFGGGLGFKIAPKIDLFAQFGYALGLSNILKNNPASTVKLTGIQITGGAMFGL